MLALGAMGCGETSGPDCRGDCDDSNDCTVGACVPLEMDDEGASGKLTGYCQYTAVEDGTPCGGTGTCMDGECEFTCLESPPAPPVLADACAALEGEPNLINPETCNTDDADYVEYQLTVLLTERDPNAGFNLDEVTTLEGDGSFEPTSCVQGGVSNADGAGGVDNQLGSLGPLFEGIGESPDFIDAVFENALCADPMGPVRLGLLLELNADDDCARLTLGYNREFPVGPLLLNFVDDCLSGTLGDLPFVFPGPTGQVRVTINNTSVAVSIDQAAGFSGILAGTLEGENAAALLNAIEVEGDPFGSIAIVTFDILQSLEVEPDTVCDSLSLVLQAGGAKVD